MTRLERAQKAAENAAKTLAESRQKVREEQAKARIKAHKENDKRRYHVGALADEAGLFTLEDATIGQLLALLTPLAQLPDPVDTLDRLIGVPLGLATAGRTVFPDDEDDA